MSLSEQPKNLHETEWIRDARILPKDDLVKIAMLWRRRSLRLTHRAKLGGAGASASLAALIEQAADELEDDATLDGAMVEFASKGRLREIAFHLRAMDEDALRSIIGTAMGTFKLSDDQWSPNLVPHQIAGVARAQGLLAAVAALIQPVDLPADSPAIPDPGPTAEQESAAAALNDAFVQFLTTLEKLLQRLEAASDKPPWFRELRRFCDEDAPEVQPRHFTEDPDTLLMFAFGVKSVLLEEVTLFHRDESVITDLGAVFTVGEVLGLIERLEEAATRLRVARLTQVDPEIASPGPEAPAEART